MFMPTYTVARSERLCDLVLVAEHRRQQMKRAGNISWAVLIGQQECVFCWEEEFVGAGIVFHVAIGCLRRKPLPHVAFRRAGTRRKFTSGERARIGHRLVEPEFLAHQRERSAHADTEIVHELKEKLLDLLGVEGGSRFLLRLSRHRSSRIAVERELDRGQSYRLPAEGTPHVERNFTPAGGLIGL